MSTPTAASPKSARPMRADFPHFLTMPTRWMDNDVYGHVNNVIYYSFFDTLVNRYLIDRGVLDYRSGNVIGYVVETTCRYHAAIAYPDDVHGALRVARVGNSSVRYEVALFRNDDAQAAADGHFVHVYVERATQRPVPVPDAMREALASLVSRPTSR